VSGIADRGGLDVSGIASRFAPVERTTSDLMEAVEGAALIAITTLNNDHQAVAHAQAPVLQDGQIVCLIPGYVGGALEFRRALAAGGCRCRGEAGRDGQAEMDNFPFTGGVLGSAEVRVASLKRQLQVWRLCPPRRVLPWSTSSGARCRRPRQRATYSRRAWPR
jgi:hypothetical protein